MTALRWVPIMLLYAPAVYAQRAPELYGRVVDSSGAPIAGARIHIEQLDLQTWTDAAGGYRLRAGRSCDCAVVASRIGYADVVRSAKLVNGSATRVDFEMQPSSVPLAPLRAVSETGNFRTLDRAAIEQSRATTAGDLLATMSAVVVTRTTPLGPQYITIRGSTAGQVLVLLDGTPINDPVTGAADLSRIDLHDIESISVLPGAHSARYGARALAGVVLIRTRRPGSARELSLRAGSLGAYGAGIRWGGRLRTLHWSVGANLQQTGGDFEFVLDEIDGSIAGQRRNADVSSVGTHAALEAPLASGTLRVRPAIQSEDRGLPGKAYAPTPAARQTARAAGVSGTWRGPVRSFSGTAVLSYTRQRIAFSDPVPPFGLPYADTTQLQELRGAVEIMRSLRDASIAIRVGGRTLVTEATALAAAARTSSGLHAAASAQFQPLRSWWFAHVDVRADYDALRHRTFGTWALTAGVQGPFTLQLSHRTSYAPPSLADLFFSEAVGVVPNPDLRAERVPGELEASLKWRGSAGAAAVALNASAFTASTHDLIAWEPDYRFVWSPRNIDVRRRGADAASHITLGHVSVRSWVAHNRTTYRHRRADIQLAYRPRNTAAVTLEYAGPAWQGRLEGHYLGERNTAATDLNSLDGFWTWSATTSHSFAAFDHSFTAFARGERIFNRHESLIFGFPQPRRVLTFGLRVKSDHLESEQTR